MLSGALYRHVCTGRSRTSRGSPRVCVAILALLSLVVVGCGSAETNGVSQSGEVYIHDEGAVFVDPADRSTWRLSHVFSFRNPSRGSLAGLTVERMSCGCAACVIGQAVLPPGAETDITLSYDVPCKRDARRENVLIATNVAEFPKFVLVLAAEIYPRLVMLPEKPLEATVAPGRFECIDAAFAAYEPATEEPKPIELLARGDGLRVERTTRARAETQGSVRKTLVECTLRVCCPAPREDGYATDQFTGELEVKHGDRAVKKLVLWHAARFVRASPPQLFLQARSTGADEAVVRLAAEQPFTISAVQADSPYLQCDALSDRALPLQEIRVRLKPARVPTMSSRSIVVVRIDHPKQRVIKIPAFILWSN